MKINKLHILLTCNLGASTGIMAGKMRDIVKNSEALKDADIIINAQPGDLFEDLVTDYDVILVAPQMMHKYKYFEEIAHLNGKVITSIDPRDYGSVNASNIIKTAIVAYQEVHNNE